MYGPVRTVVWQGSAGNRRPYADLARHPTGIEPDDPSVYSAAQFSIGQTYAEAAHSAENSGDDEPQIGPEETERPVGV